jgi:general secretion pathway protein A
LRNDIARNRTTDADLDAWTQLLARWQVNSSQIAVRDAAKCQPVLSAGLDCLHGFGSVDQIARFDRPMLLILHQGDARTPAMLVDVRGDNVRIEIDGTVHNVKKNELGEVWSGEFMAIWRLPGDVPAALRPGDAGPGVAWVKQQLAMMDKGKSADAGPAYFDRT